MAKQTPARARRRAGSKGGGRKRLVSKDEIVAHAISLGDERGLDELSVRQLAEGLNIGTMTLYSYYKGKDEILDAMADKLLGTLRVPIKEGADFGEIVRAAAHAYRDLFRRHPSALRLLAARASKSDVAAGGMNETLAALRSAGLDAAAAVKAMGVIVQYTLGFSLYQMARSWGSPDADPESRRVRTLHYASYNAVAFPHVVEAAAELTQLPTEEQFEFGLDAIALGLWQAVGGTADA